MRKDQRMKMVNEATDEKPVGGSEMPLLTLRTPRDGKKGNARVLKVNGFNNFSSSPSTLLEVIKATPQDLSKNHFFKL